MNSCFLGGAIGPIIYAIIVIIAGEMRPGYSHVKNFISELGATGSENAAFMNYPGFVFSGLLITSLGLALGIFLPRERLILVASVLVGVFGLGVAASGVVSCDLGCPQGGGTTANLLHNNIAPFAFLCLIVASLIFGVHWRSIAGLRGLAYYSLISGLVAMGFLILLAFSLETRELTGLWQRLMLFVLFSWCVIVSLKMGRHTHENAVD